MPDWELSKVLAALLTERGDYSYVDKLGYAPTPDLAVLHLKEALRDVHSLMSGKIENESVKELLNSVNWDSVDEEISKVASSRSREELREKVSVISAEALALSAKMKGG